MARLIDLTGQTYGRLTVLKRAPNISPGKTSWLCRCECGNEKVVAARHLRSGGTSSCGCYREELRPIYKPFKHGMSNTKVYRAWQQMKNRCTNPNDNRYQCYGGRGITVCDEWINSFESFYRDMGDPPSESHSVDRINNNGPYAPWNCRWATAKEQAANRRPWTKRNQTNNLHRAYTSR